MRSGGPCRTRSRLVRFFDLGSGASLATWLTVVALVACAALLTLIALDEKAAATRLTRHWAALAVIAAGMSVDKQAQFHDAGLNPLLREHLGLGGLLYQGWVVIAFASALVVLLTYRRFLLVLPSKVRRALLLAGALYVAGEAGMEMIGGWLFERRGEDVLYASATTVEESLGLLGVVIALGALLTYIRDLLAPLRITVAGKRTSAADQVARNGGRPMALHGGRRLLSRARAASPPTFGRR